ncbi:MAG TPA: hypothetical protein PKA27_06165 [Fimbriimonadaceae bacterium]|nr:hypothetical protein [Fimbriimonadaceae bacterium]
MKKTDLRADYGSELGKGVRGKYYEAAIRAKGLARIDPDLLTLFPSSEAINKALRASLPKSKKA